MDRPDWSEKKAPSKRSRRSQRACGELFRAERKFPKTEQVLKNGFAAAAGGLYFLRLTQTSISGVFLQVF